MKAMLPYSIAILCAGMVCGAVAAQEPDLSQPGTDSSRQTSTHEMAPPTAPITLGAVPLDWTPPALAELNMQAAMKSSFMLDRNLLHVAAGLVPDSEEQDRQIINRLDGVSVHILRFGDTGIPDEDAVNAIRAAYHLRGWKHLVTTTNAGGPWHNDTTDVWLVLDGANVRGAVVLAETPKSLTLVSIAGNISPVDLLHLRGHFGIPRFDGAPIERQ
ncbi:MAG: hypothetical protein KGL64_05525 [Acidobacteriota bacterium]|nr:hypothetical protein [Acidobacteriota bacterium]